VADLIGLTAVSQDGAALGRVAAVHNFGASDIIEVALNDDGGTILVAFTDDTIPEVDIAGGRLVLVPPEEIEASGEDEA
jgi:16S rRNA processing protein RimM